ncbi:hypothetical protein I6A94_19780 [Frankia sp. CN4]|nr:hypothetical protein [Frankia nepalensis]
MDVPPVPSDAAGALVLAAPAGRATARLDGRAITVPAGDAVAVPLPVGYPGGGLTVAGGPVVATELVGLPAARAAGADGRGGQDGRPSQDGGLAIRTVSSVLPIATSGAAAPVALAAGPAAAG